MAMTMTLKHLQKTESGKWQYRRRWPTTLKGRVSKAPFKVTLRGQSEAELLREYPKVDAEYHRRVRELLAQRDCPTHLSPRDRWQAAVIAGNELAAGVKGLSGGVGVASDGNTFDTDDDDRRDVVAESLHLQGADPLTIKAVLVPHATAPAHTIRDAINAYVRDRHGNGEGAAGNREAKVRVERMFKRVAKALGDRFTIPLRDLMREDARKVVAFMLASDRLGGGKLSPASVKREVNQIKAVISYGLREFDLLREGAINPFDKIEVKGAGGDNALQPDSEKRHPLPPEVIAAMRSRLTGDLHIIWRLLEWTGCRLAEVTGLRVEDVVVDSDLPCIRVRWNEDRRLKNVVSIRSVPLVGDGLEAAKAALKLPRDSGMVFTRYGHHKGAGNASNALMAHVRKETTNSKHVVHSLRHNLADRLTTAEVPDLTANLIRGHSLGGVGNRVYGGDRAKLTVTTRALKLAFGLPEGTPSAPMVAP